MANLRTAAALLTMSLLSLVTSIAAAIPPATCRQVALVNSSQRAYRRNPGLQGASLTDVPLSVGTCLLVCATQTDLISFAAFGYNTCFCGNANNSSLAASSSCFSGLCPSNDSCFVGEQNIYDALVLNPIFNATLLASSNQLRSASLIFSSIPSVNVSASTRFPATISAADVDEQVSASQQVVTTISNLLTDTVEVPVRPTFSNRRGLVYARYRTSEASEQKTKSYKVLYPVGASLSLELDFANNTPGYYPVMQEFRARARINLGSNLSAEFNFGDGSSRQQLATLPDTFPVTYRRSLEFSGSPDMPDPPFSVTVFSSFFIDANVTIRTVVPLVRATKTTEITVLALRPMCSAPAVYCNRANACSQNCSALSGGRGTACGSLSSAAWSSGRRICRSGVQQQPALFSGSYYISQSVVVNVSISAGAFQSVRLPADGLSLQPGDLIGLFDPQSVVMCENYTENATALLDKEFLLSWNTSFVGSLLNGLPVRSVNLSDLSTTSTFRPSVKAMQFFGNRQLSMLGTHRYTNVGCNWTTNYCNDEYPYNITASIVSGVDSQIVVSRLPLIVQIPLINVTFSAPDYYASNAKVPYQIGSHSGSKPVYSWSVNASLADFNNSMLNSTGYNFPADGFYNVCLTTTNKVSSFFVCRTVIIQHSLKNDTVFIIPELPLSTTPTSQALSTMYFTWNATNSDVPTNVSAVIEPADGGAPVQIIVDWSVSRRVVEYKRNYSRGIYARGVRMFNQVSQLQSNNTLVVQETIMGPVLTASAYILYPGQTVTYILTLAWGSDYTATISFGDGSNQTVTVNDNNHTATFVNTYAAIGNYSASCRVVNLISQAFVSLDRISVEVMFVPRGFALMAPVISLLRRPENTTNTVLQLCRNATIGASEPLYAVFYDIDLGDGSLVVSTGNALLNCDTSNSANNNACSGQFGSGFAHCQFTPTLQYRFPGNFTATVRLYNRAGSQTILWSQLIYSQIVNLNREITLYPGVYTGNAPVQAMSLTYAYPIEYPLKFIAVTQFGQLSPLLYNWDFGDGGTSVTTVNWIERKFDKPLRFTVRVNVTNPLVWQADAYNIELKRSAIGVSVGAKVATPMNYPYEVTVDFGAFPTNTCFIIDFSNFGTRVSKNGSMHMFGFESFCNSDPYFSSRKAASYWDTHLTDFYLSGYQASLTGKPFSKTNIYKNFEYYGAVTVSMRAANSFSSQDFFWTMTVSKGFCSVPVPNLAPRMTVTQFSRNQDVEIGGDMKISCYNISTHVKWTIEEMNNGTGLWTNYQTQLQAFYTKHRPTENLTNLLEGDWSGVTNLHLRRLTLPAYSLHYLKAYRVCAIVVMNDEITINASECVTFYVYKAALEPCFRMHYSKNNMTWIAVENPAQAPYGSVLRLDPSCSVNPNKFEADGERPCWSFDTYCRHDCEQIAFGANYSYNASGQQLGCRKPRVSGGFVNENTCFIAQSLVTWHYLKPVSLADWSAINVTSSSYPNEIVKGVYDRIPDWKSQAAIKKYNYLYYIANSMVYIDTSFSFEGGTVHLTTVVSDLCDSLAPMPTQASLMITTGEPPIVSGISRFT